MTKPDDREGGVAFSVWNVAGLKKKLKGEMWAEEFEVWLKGKDVVGLVETWVGEEEWMGVVEKLPGGWAWLAQHAQKESDRGRAKGGIVMGIRQEKGQVVSGTEKYHDAIVSCRVRVGQRTHTFGVVYACGGDDTARSILDGAEDSEEWLVGGDWNVRIGELKGGMSEWGEWRDRSSTDKIVNKGGYEWMEWIRSRGWDVLNWCTEGDWAGEKTYYGGRGSSVIDMMIMKGIGRDCIRGMRVENRLGSDHFPISVELGWERENADQAVQSSYVVWNERERRKVKKKLTEVGWSEIKGLEEVEQVMSGSLTWKKGSNALGKLSWFDVECKQERNVLRNCVKNGGKEDVQKTMFC